LGESRKWRQALHQKFGERIEEYDVIEMINIPIFLPKSIIRSKLSKEPFLYLIDWEGNVFEQFSVNKTYTLMFVDTKGSIVYRLSEPFSSEKFSVVCSKVKQLLSNKKKQNTATSSHIVPKE